MLARRNRISDIKIEKYTDSYVLVYVLRLSDDIEIIVNYDADNCDEGSHDIFIDTKSFKFEKEYCRKDKEYRVLMRLRKLMDRLLDEKEEKLAKPLVKNIKKIMKELMKTELIESCK